MKAGWQIQKVTGTNASINLGSWTINAYIAIVCYRAHNKYLGSPLGLTVLPGSFHGWPALACWDHTDTNGPSLLLTPWESIFWGWAHRSIHWRTLILCTLRAARQRQEAQPSARGTAANAALSIRLTVKALGWPWERRKRNTPTVTLAGQTFLALLLHHHLTFLVLRKLEQNQCSWYAAGQV